MKKLNKLDTKICSIAFIPALFLKYIEGERLKWLGIGLILRIGLMCLLHMAFEKMIE